jgi:hypothetical protein
LASVWSGPRVSGLNVDVENCEVGGRVSKLVAIMSTLLVIIATINLSNVRSSLH